MDRDFASEILCDLNFLGLVRQPFYFNVALGAL